MGIKRKPGERKMITGPYGTYEQYYLSDVELAKYRAMPPDEYWETNSRPIRPPEFKSRQDKKNKNGA
ncbi:hypothetical protein GCM10010913_05090 [Paenibacillus aceti]|uniref:Uncharacterized protein n=1 Tax=Paenibacillus aceti TaxID=1820010 RepID=A0ABQ1VPB3_9BACL|nr:hypothetical protein GCM10010913_05090 [Paenibacillus aceti]